MDKLESTSLKVKLMLNNEASTIILSGKDTSGRDYSYQINFSEHGDTQKPVQQEMMRQMSGIFNTILSQSNQSAPGAPGVINSTELIQHIDDVTNNLCKCRLSYNQNGTVSVFFDYNENKIIKLNSSTILKTNQVVAETLHLPVDIKKITTKSSKTTEIREKMASFASTSKKFASKTSQKIKTKKEDVTQAVKTKGEGFKQAAKTKGEDFKQSAEKTFKRAKEKVLTLIKPNYSQKLAKEITALAQIKKTEKIDLNNPKHARLLIDFSKKIKDINEENDGEKLIELFANKEFCDVFERLKKIMSVNEEYKKLYNAKNKLTTQIIEDIISINDDNITSITSNRLISLIDYDNAEATSKRFTNVLKLLKIETNEIDTDESLTPDEAAEAFNDIKIKVIIFIKKLIENENTSTEKIKKIKYFLEVSKFCSKNGDSDMAETIQSAVDNVLTSDTALTIE